MDSSRVDVGDGIVEIPLSSVPHAESARAMRPAVPLARPARQTLENSKNGDAARFRCMA